MKELFLKYLKKCTLLSDKSANNYCGGIKVIDQWMKKLFPEFTSCFDYKDSKGLDEYVRILLNDSEFKKFNESSSSKGMYSGSIEWYLRFLQAIELFNCQNLVIKQKNLPLAATINSSLVRAIRTKPFVLLAGISGTGKSRIVRKLAQACWEPGSDEAKVHKPSNFEMVQVKPNWHDSSELLGYVSRIGDKPQFIAGDFLKFIARAWENPDVPYFLCLDEMNLAPVEQYFAEYLSVVESRKLQDDGKTIISDPLMKKEDEEWYHTLIVSITNTEKIRNQFLKEGIAIPRNLIVVGTVNMDETTYSFSRKVLDRAMTIEMNEVDLHGGLHKADDMLPHIEPSLLLADAVEGFDVYEPNQESCDKAIAYLDTVNKVLDKTPFKVAYRTRNEFLIYTVNALRLAGEEADVNATIANALDEVTSMKILSRIEGDKRKVGFLSELRNVIKDGLEGIDGTEHSEDNSISLSKIATMEEKLKSGYTSFWD